MSSLYPIMESAEPPTTKHVSSKYDMLLMFLTFSGISFFFFLGFPFGNHQESYMWIPQLERLSFPETFINKVEPVANHRPLGIACAWITYHLSKGLVLQQLVNWLFVLASFAVLFRFSSNRRLFSLVAFFTGAGFFSGYIYLFHLQGVFYGPLQLYIAFLLIIAGRKLFLSKKVYISLFVCTAIVALFHPFALLVFILFSAGIAVEGRILKSNSVWVGIIIVMNVMLWWLLVPSLPSMNIASAVRGALLSYQLTEINSILTILSFLLTAISIYDIGLARRYKLLTIIAVTGGAILFYVSQIPIMLLWIAACGIKMITLRKWSILFLIISTSLFPLATGTGSPTYVVFVVMVCIYSTAFQSSFSLAGKSTYALAAFTIPVLGIILLATLLHYRLPVIDKFILPILAEKEKTWQMERIIEKHVSDFALQGYHLILADSANFPVLSGNNLNRIHRPPTHQFFLDYYLNQSKTTYAKKKLLVSFGSVKSKDSRVMWEEQGEWNGSAFASEQPAQ